MHPGLVGRPVLDLRIMLPPPRPDLRVHDPPPDRRHHRRDRHHRVAQRQLRRLVLAVGLKQRKPPARLVVMVGMPLQVDQQPVRRLVRGVPRMPRHHPLVLPAAEILPRQPVMLHVVRQLQLPDGRDRLHQEQPQPRQPADREGQRQRRELKQRVLPERVRPVPHRSPAPRQHRLLRPPGRAGALEQHPEEEPVEPFVVPRRDRIPRGAHVHVMDQQVFRPEVAVEHRRQQQVAQPPLQPVALVGGATRGHRRSPPCRTGCPRRRTARPSPRWPGGRYGWRTRSFRRSRRPAPGTRSA